MQSEMDAMESNITWTVVPLPPNKHTIGCRWVYKIKYNSDGTIERHKACLVAKGYTQQEGVEFKETFSPGAKLTTIKVLLSLATQQHWHLCQLDVHNAFFMGISMKHLYGPPYRLSSKGGVSFS